MLWFKSREERELEAMLRDSPEAEKPCMEGDDILMDGPQNDPNAEWWDRKEKILDGLYEAVEHDDCSVDIFDKAAGQLLWKLEAIGDPANPSVKLAGSPPDADSYADWYGFVLDQRPDIRDAD